MERRLGSQGFVRRALSGILIAAAVVSCGVPEEEVMELKPEADVPRELAAGETHAYELVLEADQFVEVVAHQLGVDVALVFYSPDGEQLLEVDSPTGRQGRERLLAVAETAGTYRLKVRAVEVGAPTGDYRLIVKQMRPASPEDRRRAAAERTFSQAEALYLERTKEPLKAALDLYQEARTVWQELGDRGREADALLRLGWTRRNLEEHADALVLLEEARELYRETGDGPGEAKALNSLGGVWILLRENQEALPLVEQSLELARELANTLIQAESLNNLGVIHKRLGETDAAIEAYKKAQECYEELGEPQHLARIRNHLANLLITQGQLLDAADNLQEAAEIWTKLGEPRRAAMALSTLGDVRKRQGRLEEALQSLAEALRLRQEVEDRNGEAKTLNILGTTHLLLEDFDRARGCYEDAQKIFEDIGNSTGQAVALVNLGRLHVETGEPQKALDLHQQAAPLVEAAGDRTVEVSNLYGMAKALHDLGDFEAARKHLEETLQQVEELRAGTRNEALRIAFFATRQHYYELYVDVLVHLGDDAAAFVAGERRRARALLEALGAQTDGIRRHASPELLEKERSLQAELNDLERRRVALWRLRPAAEEKIAEIKKQQRATVLELENVRGKLRQELAQPHPLSLAEAKDLLSPATLLLAYSLGDERSFLWRLSRDELRRYTLPGRQKIEDAALQAHELLTSRSPDVESEGARSFLADLSETLLGPVAGELDGRRLLIVAEGALLQLPFAALPGPAGMEDPPDHLVRRLETVYLPSVSVLRTLRKRLSERYPAPGQLAIFADPVFVYEAASEGEDKDSTGHENKELRRAVELYGSQRLVPLPHTRDEAAGILKIARGEVMTALGFEATKEKVLTGELDRYKILHFATHGLIHREQPELSGLVLSLFNEKGEYQDGFLRLHEIYNLRLAADLVVLSACRTGVGREVRGEGFLGLTRGFLHAGASRLLVSLWSVDDQGTAELMKRFYWNLLEGGAPPTLALHAAQRSMLNEEQWSRPYYWAGFVFQGEWWPPGEEPPIGASEAGGIDEDPLDPDYPGPGKDCDELSEPWMRALCKLLQEMSGD